MILSDKTILQEIAAGNIVIDPLNPAHVNPNSVDLTLAPEFKRYAPGILDPRKPLETISFKIPEDGIVISPGDVYLYACNERIGVKNNIRAKVEGKSSLGRLGLFIHVTAGFIDTGFEGSLVLELVATRSIKLYPNMKICQVEFARVEGEILETYDKKAGSKYHGQTGVQESKYHENFK